MVFEQDVPEKFGLRLFRVRQLATRASEIYYTSDRLPYLRVGKTWRTLLKSVLEGVEKLLKKRVWCGIEDDLRTIERYTSVAFAFTVQLKGRYACLTLICALHHVSSPLNVWRDFSLCTWFQLNFSTATNQGYEGLIPTKWENILAPTFVNEDFFFLIKRWVRYLLNFHIWRRLGRSVRPRGTSRRASHVSYKRRDVKT